MFMTPYVKRANSVATFNPFREMEELERDFFGDHSLEAFKTDIRDDGDAFVLEADLPGFKKEDIHIDLQDGGLTISAQRHSEYEQKDKKGNYLRKERAYGSFTRSFDTEGIDTQNIKAAFENGVLTLRLPKRQQPTPISRRLEIE